MAKMCFLLLAVSGSLSTPTLWFPRNTGTLGTAATAAQAATVSVSYTRTQTARDMNVAVAG